MDKINFVNNSEPDLSAENLNLLQTNVENAISQVSMEIVSNSNGTAYKFKNGLMIVTQKFEVTISDFKTWGSLYTVSVEDDSIPNFPVAFSNTPTVTRSIRGVSNGNAWISSNLDKQGLTKSCNFDIIRATNIKKPIVLEISIIAIGLWK